MKKRFFLFLLFSLLIFVTCIQGCKQDNDNSSEINSPQEDYLIAFLRKGNLWIMLEDGTGQKQLTQSGKVIAFTCKGNNIYFGELDSLILNVKYLHIDNLKTIESLTALKSNREYFFVDEWYQPPRGKMGWVNDSVLGVSANYEWGGGFQDTYSINLLNKNVNRTKWNQVNYERVITRENIERSEANINNGQFFSRKTGKEYELYYVNNENQEIKISNTQQYTPRECWGDNVTSFSYILTPSGKVVYWFIMDCGDLAHGVLHIANLDGSNQVLITDNFTSGYMNFNISQGSGEFMIRLYDGDFGKYNLVSFVGKLNERVIIAEDVDYFELIK